MIAKILLIAIIFNLSTARLRFAISEINDGSFEPLPKKKSLKKDIGEDAFVALPFGLVVADGIGSCEFSSSFFARTLTTKIGLALNQLNTEIAGGHHRAIESLKDNLNKSVKLATIDYNLKSTLHISSASFDKLKMKKIQIAASEVKKVSSTLISVFIMKNQLDRPTLMVYQMGDSLVSIFRKKESSVAPGQFYYELVYKTKEMQHYFNCPKQFSTASMDNVDKQSQAESFPIMEDDIVIVGSDGLWDNIHTTVLTFAVNSMVKMLGTFQPNERLITDTMERIARNFARALDRNESFDWEAEVAKRSYKPPPVVEETSSWSFFNVARNILDCLNFKICRRQKEEDIDEGEISVDPNETIIKSDHGTLAINSNQNKKSEFKDAQDWLLDELYLRCGFRRLVEIYYLTPSSGKYMSRCAQETIRSSFGFTEDHLKHFKAAYQPKIFSGAIKHLALTLSNLPRYKSRFALLSNQNGIMREPFGKQDDITVVTGLVVEGGEPVAAISNEWQNSLISAYDYLLESDLKMAIHYFLNHYEPVMNANRLII